MLRTLYSSIPLVAALVFSAGAMAQQQQIPAPKDIDRNLIDRVIAVTNSTQAIEQIPPQLRAIAADDARAKRLDADGRRRLEEMLGNVSDTRQLLEIMRNTLSAGYNEQRYRNFLVKYQGPLVKKMVDLELAASRDAAPDARQKFGERVRTQRPPKERLDAIDKLDELTQGTENVAEVNFVIAARAELPNADPRNGADREKLQTLKRNVARNVEQVVFMNMLYAYDGASQKELDDYVKLVSDEDITYTLRAVASGLTDTMLSALGAVYATIDGRDPGAEPAKKPAAEPAPAQKPRPEKPAAKK